MEMELNSLIEKIKKEGITEAKSKSEEIIKQAQEQKNTIIKEAEDKAGVIIKKAEKEAERLKDNSQKAIIQAVRDAALSLKEQIKNVFEAILKREIEQTLSDEFIAQLILKLAKSWSEDKKADLEILIKQKDKKRLEELVLSKFKTQLSSGITFKVSPNIDKGIYIGIKGKDVYYDFTDEAILEILKEYLRPFIVKIIEGKKHG